MLRVLWVFEISRIHLKPKTHQNSRLEEEDEGVAAQAGRLEQVKQMGRGLLVLLAELALLDELLEGTLLHPPPIYLGHPLQADHCLLILLLRNQPLNAFGDYKVEEWHHQQGQGGGQQESPPAAHEHGDPGCRHGAQTVEQSNAYAQAKGSNRGTHVLHN